MSVRIPSFFIRHVPPAIRQWLVDLRNVGRTLPDTVTVNGKSYKVAPHKFWIRFNRGEWEPDLNRFFERHVNPSKRVLDIGAWIGPSLFTALSHNAKSVIVVEANPETCAALETHIRMNSLEDVAEVHEYCIAGKTGEKVSFGPVDSHVEHSSVNGIGGEGFTVQTMSFTDFLETLDLSDINIVKIDVEGGERLLTDGLKVLADVPGKAIYLAMHPPFWPDKSAVAEEFIAVCTLFDVFDSGEHPLDEDTLRRWMMSEEKTIYPGRTGRFFDIILKSKGNG